MQRLIQEMHEKMYPLDLPKSRLAPVMLLQGRPHLRCRLGPLQKNRLQLHRFQAYEHHLQFVELQTHCRACLH